MYLRAGRAGTFPFSTLLLFVVFTTAVHIFIPQSPNPQNPNFWPGTLIRNLLDFGIVPFFALPDDHGSCPSSWWLFNTDYNAPDIFHLVDNILVMVRGRMSSLMGSWGVFWNHLGIPGVSTGSDTPRSRSALWHGQPVAGRFVAPLLDLSCLPLSAQCIVSPAA